MDFLGLPGCITAGRMLDEVRKMAVEALAPYLEGMMVDKAPMPAVRSVRVNAMLPEDLLRAIDRVASNRSGFLAEAAREKLRAQRV